MTDVIVQHLLTEKKYHIRCHDYVRLIALYNDRLAVQLPNQVVVYELGYNEETSGNRTKFDLFSHLSELNPKVKWRINKKLDCYVLVVVSNHIIQCQVLLLFWLS